MSTTYPFWKNAVKTALLGTSQTGGELPSLPAAIADAGPAVSESATDTEHLFLRLTTLIWQYSRAGFLPVADATLAPAPAPAEALPYCNTSATALLRQLIEANETLLLHHWLERCTAAGQIVPPLHIPPLLDLACKTTSLRRTIMQVAGNRGQWLCQFFPDWHKLPVVADEKSWEEGQPAERQAALRRLRERNAQVGLALLRESWGGEQAAHKELFLSALTTRLSVLDEGFLLQAFQEKSKKVKQQAAELLFSIPESGWVQQCTAIAIRAIQLQQVRNLLIMKRMAATITLPESLPKELFAAGLEQVSSTPNVPDPVYWLQQVVARTPPQRWKAHFGMTADKVVATFTTDLQDYIPSLCSAALRFGDSEFAIALMQQTDQAAGLLACIPTDQRESFAVKLPDTVLVQHLDALSDLPSWSEKLTRNVIQGWHSSLSPYAVQGEMKLYLRQLAPGAAQVMRSLSFSDEYAQRAWHAAANECERFSALQTTINQAFSTNPL